jgi:hypothetical protein
MYLFDHQINMRFIRWQNGSLKYNIMVETQFDSECIDYPFEFC